MKTAHEFVSRKNRPKNWLKKREMKKNYRFVLWNFFWIYQMEKWRIIILKNWLKSLSHTKRMFNYQHIDWKKALNLRRYLMKNLNFLHSSLISLLDEKYRANRTLLNLMTMSKYLIRIFYVIFTKNLHITTVAGIREIRLKIKFYVNNQIFQSNMKFS